MAGSVLVAMARTKEEVVERLQRDLYTSEGVWDWKKVGHGDELNKQPQENVMNT